MILRHLTLTLFFAFASIALAGKPNIILIVVDDLGNEWVSYYGANNIQTLHIDKLAKGDVRPQYSPCKANAWDRKPKESQKSKRANRKNQKKRKQINKGGEKYHG